MWMMSGVEGLSFLSFCDYLGNYLKQAEAEVVPSSSSVKFKFLKFS